MWWSELASDHRTVEGEGAAMNKLPRSPLSTPLIRAHNHGPRGVHLLGPLSNKVIRIAPPLVITKDEAVEALELLAQSFSRTIKEASVEA